MTEQPHMDRLNRFLLTHEHCEGETEISPPDLEYIEDDALWIILRCPGCGATRHERTPLAELFADLPKLLQGAGAATEELVDAFDRDDEEAITRLSERIMGSSTMLTLVLRNIRRAEANEKQN